MKQLSETESSVFSCPKCDHRSKSFVSRDAGNGLGQLILRCTQCDQDYRFEGRDVRQCSSFGFVIEAGAHFYKLTRDGSIEDDGKEERPLAPYEQLEPPYTCGICGDKNSGTYAHRCKLGGSSYGATLRQCADIADKRQEAYGSPAINFANIQAICKEAFGLEISMKSIAMVMVATKLSRERNAHKEDNLLDAINYIAILNQFCDASMFQDSHTPSTTSPITNEDER